MIRTCFALVISIAVPSAALADRPGRSESIAIKGTVDHPRTVALADLQHEPQTTETVFMHTGHGALTDSFTGVLLDPDRRSRRLSRPRPEERHRSSFGSRHR